MGRHWQVMAGSATATVENEYVVCWYEGMRPSADICQAWAWARGIPVHGTEGGLWGRGGRITSDRNMESSGA